MWLNEIFERSFKSIKNNYGTWLLIALIYFVLSALPALITQPNVLEFYKDLSLGTSITSIPEVNNVSFLEVLGLAIIILITPGIVAIGLKGADGEVGKLDLITKKASLALKFLGFFVVYFIAVAIGTLALVIPGLYLLIKYSMTPFVLIENEKIGVFDAMKKSSEMVKGRYWGVFFNFFVLALAIFFISFLVFLLLELPVLHLLKDSPILKIVALQAALILSASLTHPIFNVGYGVIYRGVSNQKETQIEGSE